MENRERKRKGLSAPAILGILVLVLVPLMLNVFLTPGGGGSGDYSFYAGPVLPMTSLSGAESVEVTRNVDFDFAPYAAERKNTLDNGSVVITDSYELTNTTPEMVTVELAYGFEGQFIDEPEQIPHITVNGTAAQAQIYPAVDISGDVHYAFNWGRYEKALQENDFLSAAMAGTPQWDSPVTVYHFSDIVYEEPEVEDTIHYGVQFSMPEDSAIWVREYGMTNYDTKTDKWQVLFREEWGDGWMFVIGEPPEDMAFVGNVGFNITKDSALQGLSVEVETYKSSFAECLWKFAQEYDFWKDNSGYPNPGLITPELLYDGAMKRITDPDYRNPSGEIQSMSAVFYDVVVDIRMLYWVFPVEIPAGETVAVSAVYNQEPSTDNGGPYEPREGYDIATKLGSNLNFTALSAGLTNDHLIKIVDQNFGFDLEKGITDVLLDLSVERYYMDIAPQ